MRGLMLSVAGLLATTSALVAVNAWIVANPPATEPIRGDAIERPDIAPGGIVATGGPFEPTRSPRVQTLARPLFSPTRRRPAPAREPEPEPVAARASEPVAPPPPAVEPPVLRVLGLRGVGADRAALVDGADGSAWLRAGDSVGSWSVSLVGERGLTLEHAERTHEVGMFGDAE